MNIGYRITEVYVNNVKYYAIEYLWFNYIWRKLTDRCGIPFAFIKLSDAQCVVDTVTDNIIRKDGLFLA